MRAWYVAESRPRILDRSTFILFGAAVVSMLVWLLPHEDRYIELLERPRGDAVSLSYARLMAARAPDDPRLARILARQLTFLGKRRDAIAVLDRHPSQPTQLLMLKLHLLRDEYFSLAEGSEDFRRERLARRIRATVNALGEKDQLAKADRLFVAEVAAAFSMPNVAAKHYTHLAESGDLPDGFSIAGKFANFGNDPEKAAALYLRAVGEQPTTEAIVGALTALSGSNQLETGVVLIRQLLREDNVPNSALMHMGRFLQRANQHEALRSWSNYCAERQIPSEYLPEWINMAIASNAIEAAYQKIPELLEHYSDDPVARRQVAQLLTWQGEADAALPHWEWLTRNAPEQVDMRGTWELAQQLYRYDSAIGTLDLIQNQRSLAQEELQALTNSHLALGNVSGAVTAVNNHLQVESSDSQAWRLGFDLLIGDERVADALDWLANMNTYVPLAPDLQIKKAELHWQQYDFESAYRTLQSVPSGAVATRPDYWSSLAALAWQFGETERTQAALMQLVNLQELDESQYNMLLATFSETDRELRRAYALRAWNSTGQPAFLLSALSDAFTSDEQNFHELLSVASEAEDQFDRYVLYWTMQARDYVRHEETELAWRAFANADALAPNDITTVAQVMWFLVEQRDQELLTNYLAAKQHLVADNEALVHPFAAAYSAIEQFAQASHYYRKAAELHPDNIAITLALADNLIAAGYADAGFRVRQHAFSQQITSLIDGEYVHPLALQHASLGTLSLPGFNKLVLSLPGSDIKGTISAIMTNLLDAGHVDGLRAYRDLAYHLGIELDPYFDYYLALMHRDLDAIQGFRDHSSRIIRAEARLALGEETNALRTALNGITTSGMAIEPLEQRYSRRLSADLLHESPVGAQWISQHRDLGSIDLLQHTARYASSLDEVHLVSSVDVRRYDANEALGTGATFNIRTLTTQATRLARNGDWRLHGRYVDTEDNDYFSASLERRWNSGRIEHTLGASWREPTQHTPLLQIFGRRDYVNASSVFRITNVDRLSASFHWNRFTDHSGNEIGDGIETEVTYNHTLLADSPNLNLIANAYWMSSDPNTLAPRTAAALRGRSVEDLLPDHIGRVALGVVLERVRTDQINRRWPNPHYRFSATVGYQWPTNEPTLSVAASIGTRIFGEDLLALSLQYDTQSSVVSDDSGASISLIYNHRLGK